MRNAYFIAVPFLALALCMCGKPRSNTKPSSFRHGELPGGWEATKVAGLAVAFYHEGYGATAGVAPVCDGLTDASLESLAQQELIGLEQREKIEESRVTVDGREAIDWVVKGSMDGVEVVLNLVVFRREGCVYDLNLVSRPDTFEKARSEFRGFVGGFAVLDD